MATGQKKEEENGNRTTLAFLLVDEDKGGMLESSELARYHPAEMSFSNFLMRIISFGSSPGGDFLGKKNKQPTELKNKDKKIVGNIIMSVG